MMTDEFIITVSNISLNEKKERTFHMSAMNLWLRGEYEKAGILWIERYISFFVWAAFSYFLIAKLYKYFNILTEPE